MQNIRSRKSLFTIAFAVVLILIIVTVAVILPLLQPATVYGGEIRQYQGQALSSINDFQEASTSIEGPQYIDISTYRLTITGLVNKTVTYTYQDIINNFTDYKKVATLQCVEGWSVKILWEGPLVTDLLKEAGVKPGAVGIIFTAVDGFSTELPLDYLNSSHIIIAYKINNVTLPADHGFPFQLVAENQAGYKWCKWITQMEVTNDPNYLGYWESRGYPNNATIP
jgi:DMSO/TMAO reductase YedYZ molybdopterin-dependent catalytic subunit